MKRFEHDKKILIYYTLTRMPSKMVSLPNHPHDWHVFSFVNHPFCGYPVYRNTHTAVIIKHPVVDSIIPCILYISIHTIHSVHIYTGNIHIPALSFTEYSPFFPCSLRALELANGEHAHQPCLRSAASQMSARGSGCSNHALQNSKW